MNEKQVALLRLEIAFWACVILGNVAPQWWARGSFTALAAVLRVRIYWLERAGDEPGRGFWARVWDR